MPPFKKQKPRFETNPKISRVLLRDKSVKNTTASPYHDKILNYINKKSSSKKYRWRQRNKKKQASRVRNFQNQGGLRISKD